MPSFEKTVKKALIDNEMTMGMLAAKLGVSLSYVSDLVKGKRNNALQIKRICTELNIPDPAAADASTIND